MTELCLTRVLQRSQIRSPMVKLNSYGLTKVKSSKYRKIFYKLEVIIYILRYVF